MVDLHEFSDVFIDSDARDELLCLDEDVLQYIVDVVQIVSRSQFTVALWLTNPYYEKQMDHVVHGDARKLDRFIRFTVEKRGILPSSIFLTGVFRNGTNFVQGGGFADVWKGVFQRRPVALKVLRLFSFPDREKMQLVRRPLHIEPLRSIFIPDRILSKRPCFGEG